MKLIVIIPALATGWLTNTERPTWLLWQTFDWSQSCSSVPIYLTVKAKLFLISWHRRSHQYSRCNWRRPPSPDMPPTFKAHKVEQNQRFSRDCGVFENLCESDPSTKKESCCSRCPQLVEKPPSRFPKIHGSSSKRSCTFKVTHGWLGLR